MLWVLCVCYTSALQYLLPSYDTVLHATQLGTLGITGTQYSTHPEYSWLVLCVVLCYAVGVLCYACLLYSMLRYVLHTLYSITIAMLYVYTEVWRVTTRWTMAKEM